MSKRILILYATYGSGHKSVAQYIQKYFNEVDKDLEILSLDLLDFSIPVIGKTIKKYQEHLMLKRPMIWNALYQMADIKTKRSFSNTMGIKLINNKKLRKLISDFNPNLTIAPHFFGGCLISKYNKLGLTNSKIITVITDYESHENWLQNSSNEDYLVVANEEDKKIFIKNRVDRKKVKVLGIPIYPKLPEYVNKEKMLKDFKLKKDKLTCLFFAGGGNGGTLTMPYLKKLLKEDTNINVIFISGRNEKVKEQANKYKKRYDFLNMTVLGFCNNIPELLTICDFVITKPGGIQTTECAYFKKPMLLLCSSGGQESANATYFTKKGFAKKVRNPRHFGRLMNSIVNNPYHLNKMNKYLSKANNNKSMEELYKLAKSVLESKGN